MVGFGSEQNWDEKQFMAKFAKDYEHYMEERGKNVSKDFEKYMEEHASKYKHYLEARSVKAAGDFQKYFEDYQKYMKSKDFKDFVDKYASDYASYLKERGQEYMSGDKKEAKAAMLVATPVEDESQKEHDALSAELKQEQQRLDDEMKYEKELREKEKEHLAEELKREAAEEAAEAKQAEAKTSKTDAKPEVLIEQRSSAFAVPAVFLAAFVAVGATFAFLRRSRQIREHEDYVMHLDAPLSTV